MTPIYAEALKLLGRCTRYCPDDLRLEVEVLLEQAGAPFITTPAGEVSVTFPNGEPDAPPDAKRYVREEEIW